MIGSSCMLGVFLAGAGLAASPLPASTSWPGFRGDGSGTTQSMDLPLEWSPQKGIAWRLVLEGYGQSSPVIWGNRAFVTSVDGPEKTTLMVHCIELSTGKLAWTKSFPASAKGRNSPMMARAAPTPVVDAGGVYSFFESGDLVALSHEGKQLWQNSLSGMGVELKNNHGLGCSPAQTDKFVILLIDHSGPSFLAAYEKSGGRQAWKTERPQKSSWTSPVHAKMGGTEIVLVSSSGAVDAYDATNGKLVASLDGFTGNNIPSPTVLGGDIFIGAGENRMRPDLEASRRSNCKLELVRGEGKSELRKVWQSDKAISHHASPVACGKEVYIVDKAGILHCLDRDNGSERYSRRLPNQQWATPIVSANHVYLFGKDGVTTVIRSGSSWNLVANNRLWTEEDFEKRKGEEIAKAKKAEAERPARPVGSPGGNGRPRSSGGPQLPAAELEATRVSAVGDVVYGSAAASGIILIRTGTELFCVGNPVVAGVGRTR